MKLTPPFLAATTSRLPCLPQLLSPTACPRCTPHPCSRALPLLRHIHCNISPAMVSTIRIIITHMHPLQVQLPRHHNIETTFPNGHTLFSVPLHPHRLHLTTHTTLPRMAMHQHKCLSSIFLHHCRRVQQPTGITPRSSMSTNALDTTTSRPPLLRHPRIWRIRMLAHVSLSMLIKGFLPTTVRQAARARAATRCL